METKERILDAAERLFGEQGYGSTSLRHVIAQAGVNLAAVHYHFGSKEHLLDAVVIRKLTPINAERMRLFDAVAAESGDGPIPLERLLEAFLRPAIAQSRKDPGFCKLMGRLHGEGLMPQVIIKNFQEVGARFLSAMRQALPELTHEELGWRVHFLVGAMAHTLQGPPQIPGWELKPPDPELLLQWIVGFFTAGFRAQAARISEVTEEVNS
jgi:AcrR family transcriptional regulator